MFEKSHCLFSYERSGSFRLPLGVKDLLVGNRGVGKDVERVQEGHVEHFEGSDFRGEGVQVVSCHVEALEQSIRAGEAVGQLDAASGCIIFLFVRVQLVVHPLDKAQPVSVFGGGIDRQGADVQSKRAAQLLVDFVGPVEALDDHVAMFVVQVFQTDAKSALQPVLHVFGPLLRPLRAVQSLRRLAQNTGHTSAKAVQQA